MEVLQSAWSAGCRLVVRQPADYGSSGMGGRRLVQRTERLRTKSRPTNGEAPNKGDLEVSIEIGLGWTGRTHAGPTRKIIKKMIIN